MYVICIFYHIGYYISSIFRKNLRYSPFFYLKGHRRCPFKYIHKLALNEAKVDRLLHSAPPRSG